MSHDLNKRRPQDSIKSKCECKVGAREWSKKFGVTKEQLKESTKNVGTSVAEVQKYLGK